MPIPFFSVHEPAGADALLARLATRSDPDADEGAKPTEYAVRAILADVKERGLASVVEFTRRFDAPNFDSGQFRVDAKALQEAAIPEEDEAILASAIANIRAFHQEQKDRSWFRTRPDGSVLGQMLLPVERAGLYVPGGKAGSTPLVSSLLMNAIPAQVAGVESIAVISPPGPDGTLNPYILAAARLLGLTELYAAGSAWAVAALAYGAGSLRPVDVIAGPGNIFVTTAKRLLIGTVGIDMIAGPSEICIVADQSADPAWAAADMLSQAEHDRLASSVCLCVGEGLGERVLEELERQCADLPRAAIARASLEAWGAVVTVPDLPLAMELANRIAPEHLELLLEKPWEALPLVRNAGAVFLGHHSPEPLGDYFAGPNHVLPTMGTARFSSALSVETFCKKTSVIAASPAFTSQSAKAVARLARLEGLEGHARSILCRASGGQE